MIDESKNNNLKLVTTEKDYLRIKDYGFKDVEIVKVELEVIEKNYS